MFSLSFLPISNEVFLTIIGLALLALLVEDLLSDPEELKNKNKSRKLLPKRCRVQLAPPIYAGSTTRRVVHPDLCSLSRFMPRNVTVVSRKVMEKESTENVVKFRRTAPSRPMTTVVSRSSVCEVPALPGTGAAAAVAGSPASSRVSMSLTASRASVSVSSSAELEICKRIVFPFPAGCEPTGPEAVALMKKFPALSRPDAVRFLVARKGSLQAAEEMAEKCLSWRGKVFPLKKADVQAAFNTFCFFPYGVAKDGSPVVYMRGALYDCTKATPEQYVLAAAYTIDWSLRQYPDQTNVTVLVHAGFVPNAPNQSADTNFIKLFIQVLSDNYPERLKRLAIFPFPWYGRAIWGMLKVFVDKRTQDKVMLLSYSGTGIPSELKEFMDSSEIPDFCGGTCTRPVPNLFDTLEE